jgi:hypothetical protein
LGEEKERQPADINMKYNKIRDVLNESSKNILGYKENKRKDWIRDTTWKNILERRNLKAKINAGKTRSEQANANKEYQSKNKEVKKIIRNDKRKYIEQLADKEQEAANLGNIKKFQALGFCYTECTDTVGAS